MSKIKAFLLGATGETGSSIVDGLIEDGNFDTTIYSRQASVSTPKIEALKQRGLTVVSAPDDASVSDLAQLLKGIDVVVSAVGPAAQLDQIRWASAALQAGIKRFIPCGFTTICPRGDIMLIRDEKETVHDHIFQLYLPFTIVDVGYWYQVSIPPVPSGKLAYALAVPKAELFGDGNAPNLLTDKRDIGRYVAKIIQDPRTLNKRVAAYGQELSQNQITEILERLSGEKLELPRVPLDEVIARKEKAVAHYNKTRDPTDFASAAPMYINQYCYSKYVRQDNTVANAEYLGYLDAQKLYPDFKPITMETFLQEALDGKAVKPYAGRW